MTGTLPPGGANVLHVPRSPRNMGTITSKAQASSARHSFRSPIERAAHPKLEVRTNYPLAVRCILGCHVATARFFSCFCFCFFGSERKLQRTWKGRAPARAWGYSPCGQRSSSFVLGPTRKWGGGEGALEPWEAATIRGSFRDSTFRAPRSACPHQECKPQLAWQAQRRGFLPPPSQP